MIPWIAENTDRIEHAVVMTAAVAVGMQWAHALCINFKAAIAVWWNKPMKEKAK